MPEITVSPDIVLYALRYGLGRLTWAHDDVCRAVAENAGALPTTGLRQAVERELAEWVERTEHEKHPAALSAYEWRRMIRQAEAALVVLRRDEL